MALSLTSTNFAKRRNMLVEIVSADVIETDEDRLWIYEYEEDAEPSVFYIVNADGSFSFSSSHMDQSITEELPAFIADEKKLREVIAFIANERS